MAAEPRGIAGPGLTFGTKSEQTRLESAATRKFRFVPYEMLWVAAGDSS
jgi:hypothetical protein